MVEGWFVDQEANHVQAHVCLQQPTLFEGIVHSPKQLESAL